MVHRLYSFGSHRRTRRFVGWLNYGLHHWLDFGHLVHGLLHATKGVTG